MNLLLLSSADFLPDGTARITGRRLRHARDVLRAARGGALRVGRLNGQIGRAEIIAETAEALHLRVHLDSPPPERPGLDLVVAMPRPKVLRRLLAAVASLGVDRVVLVNAARVEKSYFDARALAPGVVMEHLLLGLEQARDTRPPEVLVRARFRPFVEDEIDALFAGRARLVAHPDPLPTAADALAHALDGRPAVVAIGPEGGWVPFELALLRAHGFVPVSVGPRPLRVEVIVPYLLGALALATRAGGLRRGGPPELP